MGDYPCNPIDLHKPDPLLTKLRNRIDSEP